MGLLRRFTDWLGLTSSREDDKRPDPEDQSAFDHADKVAAEQTKESFPLQTLRGKGLPSNHVGRTIPWEDAPVGYETWVDVYDGPQGIGYVVNYEVQRSTKTYRKAINFGPETHREQDWEEVVEPTVPSPR